MRDPHKGPRCLLFFLPADTEGIKIQNNWDTMSLRASASHDIVWDKVFVLEERVFDRPARTWDRFIDAFCSQGAILRRLLCGYRLGRMGLCAQNGCGNGFRCPLSAR